VSTSKEKISLASTQQLKLSPSVRQETGFISAYIGDSVTLRCFYKDDVAAMFFWYKQTLGEKPRLISSFYKHDKNGTFIDELKNDPRFTLESKNGNYHLTISKLRISDSATYYCISIYAYQFQFTEGTTVDVKGSGLKIQATVHQSASESIQPGGSVTLNCTVHTGTCDGEHSVYWFKKSEESQPGLIYTHGDRNDQCERKPNTQTHTCVYNLPIKNLSLSHNMTYYCAVATCGHILFGNGTKLELVGKELFYIVFSVSQPESQARLSAPSTANAEVKFILINNLFISQQHIFLYYFFVFNFDFLLHFYILCYQGFRDVDNLHYAALSVNLPNRSRRQRNNTNSECVYSGVKQ
uniref:Ig-like domain-containing protein n=1 Tax=Sander lucioperca TaxID=283035 RepID=A0A8C9X6L7_SANLU